MNFYFSMVSIGSVSIGSAMKITDRCFNDRCFMVALSLFLGFGTAEIAVAQSSPIVSDGTLAVPSVVTSVTSTVTSGGQSPRTGYDITGGTRSGSNLFHSFDRFSVPSGQTAIFTTDNGVQNVITRVTGGLRSQIDGAIQASGNLFLINPSGITFGKDASLNVTGSFFATTAPVLRFADGVEFSADRTIAPILSVNVPVGIQWNAQPSGSIENFGNLIVPDSLTLIAPQIKFENASASAAQLKIQAPESLILNSSGLTTSNGGELSIQVGDLMAQNSRIVSSYFTVPQNTIGTLLIKGTGSLLFDKLTQVEASSYAATDGNTIYIQGKSIDLRNGSRLISQHFGTAGNAGTITLKAADGIRLSKPNGDTANFTTIASSTFVGSGSRSGDINLVASDISLRDLALIQTSAFRSNQRTGNIRVQARTSLDIDYSVVNIFDFSDQPSGSIYIDAPILNILNGSTVNSDISRGGMAGDIVLNAQDRLLVSGKGTAISSGTTGPGNSGNIKISGDRVEVTANAFVSSNTSASGRGGDISLDGRELLITDGAQIRSIATGAGSSGNITVNGRDRITIIGSGEYDPRAKFLIDGINTITASIQYIPASQLPPGSDPNGAVIIINPLYSPEPFIIPSTLSLLLITSFTGINANSSGAGAAGNISLQAPTIDIKSLSLVSNVVVGIGDSARVSIQARDLNLIYSTIFSSSIRSKNGGTIDITADKLNLKNGSILASTVDGDGGIIALDVRDRLNLRENSFITARAANLGRGGNITINNPNGFIVADSTNNDIIATANAGRGGIILINSAGIFNLTPRTIQTDGNDILASSNTGIQGTVTLKRTGREVNPAAVKLSDSILDTTNYIIPSCSSIVRNNRLVITGQGGRMPNPSQMLNLISLDVSSASSIVGNNLASDLKSTIGPDKLPSLSLIEATHWKRSADGTILLARDDTQDAVAPVLPIVACGALVGGGL